MGDKESREEAVLTASQQRALLMLGYLYLRMGQGKRAKKLFAALVALDKDDGWARRNLAAACLALGEGDAALEHVNKAIGTAPLPSRDAALHLLRARALWMAGRTDEAHNAVHAWLAAGGARQ